MVIQKPKDKNQCQSNKNILDSQNKMLSSRAPKFCPIVKKAKLRMKV